MSAFIWLDVEGEFSAALVFKSAFHIELPVDRLDSDQRNQN